VIPAPRGPVARTTDQPAVLRERALGEREQIRVRSNPSVDRLQGATVLIIDDDVRNVFALTSALELHGINVLYADNGADGLRLLSEHPGVDVVLMDAMMPDQDGYETTRRIRSDHQFAELPIIFLTAKAMPGDRESALVAGGSDYITKPVDLDELLDLLARWVQPPATDTAGEVHR